jgi:hypothetical protein
MANKKLREIIARERETQGNKEDKRINGGIN